MDPNTHDPPSQPVVDLAFSLEVRPWGASEAPDAEPVSVRGANWKQALEDHLSAGDDANNSQEGKAQEGKEPARRWASCTLSAGLVEAHDHALRVTYRLRQSGAGSVVDAVRATSRASSVGTDGTHWEGEATPSLHVLSSVDRDPSDDHPLTYRERAYALPNIEPGAAADAWLLERLSEVQREISGAPEGRFVRLALFDHAWEGRPDAAPVALLEWKDWKEGVHFLGATPTHPPSSTEGASVDPAPARAQAQHAQPQKETGAGAGTGSKRTSSPGDPLPRELDLAADLDLAAEADVAAAEPMPRPRASGDHTRLARAFEAMQEVFFLSTTGEGMAYVGQVLHRLVPCEGMAGALYDINTHEFRVVDAQGPGAEALKATAWPANRGILSSLRSKLGAVLTVQDPSSHPEYDAHVDARESLTPSSLMYIPLLHEGHLLGVVQLLNRVSSCPDSSGNGSSGTGSSGTGSSPGFSPEDANVGHYIGTKTAEFLAGVQRTQGM